LSVKLILNPTEVRVLGSLVEKQLTTPDYYPLSLNGLTNACNQLSNREPVVKYDEETVSQALDSLREKKLVWLFRGADSRVPKFGHIFPEAFDLGQKEVAALCVLMLRGPQTVGEIRGRTGRLYNFDSLAEVEQTLEGLINRDAQNLVVKLPRQAGRKDHRYAHLLSGDVEVDETPISEPGNHPRAASASERVQHLEEDVESLRRRIAELEQQFTSFKKQFE
jgi:uncharacterized protein